MGKPSSLLGFVISDEVKKFYNIDTWLPPNYTFFSVNDENKQDRLSLARLSSLV
jgi:hypothetical protein